MIEHQEPWQVYRQNGQPIDGIYATRDEFADDHSLVMGAAHVWIWRSGDSGIEVLLQKRAQSKKSWPGYYDISAAGHIDGGETPIAAAVREAQEEIGIQLDSSKLYFVLSLRTPLDPTEIDFVYLYELTTDAQFSFNDGEVESLDWLSLDDFRQKTTSPELHNIVPQGSPYFSLVIEAIQQYVS